MIENDLLTEKQVQILKKIIKKIFTKRNLIIVVAAAVLVFAGVKVYQSLFYSKAEIERTQILAKSYAKYLFADIEVIPTYRRHSFEYTVISKKSSPKET